MNKNTTNLMDNTLTFFDEDGNEVVCQILFTVKSEEFGKSYVLFYPIQDAVNDDDDDLELMAASYIEGEEGTGELFDIETDEEWEFIQDVVQSFNESQNIDDNDEEK